MYTALTSALLVAMLSTACGLRDPDIPVTAGATDLSAACAPGVAGCTDTAGDAAPSGDIESARARARALLGADETELPDDVRIARRGDEPWMLTEDHVPGRLTVELDDDGAGSFHVTTVVLELPEGRETFRA